MRIRRRLTVLAAITVTLTVGLGPAAQADQINNGPTFTVMNTSETLPDGVWFRNSPHTADTDRVTGHGVYKGERVQLRCYSWGDAVGSYGNRLWYKVINVTRPTNAGVENSGFLNAHYISDGLAANQIDAGVPDCSAPAAAATVSLAQGPTAPAGYRYAITLDHFSPNSSVSITCYDSVSPGGFYTFRLGTDSSGHAFTQNYCYSGDGPDHWVTAGGVSSNHVSWGRAAGGGAGGGSQGGGGTTAPSPPPIPKTQAMVYYSPFIPLLYEPNASTPDHPVKRLQVSKWKSSGACDPNNARRNTPTTYAGKDVTSLSGWSLGRDGVLYGLNGFNTSKASLARIKYVLLIDPGGYEQLSQSCDTTYGRMLATWLRDVPSARLVILSGPRTLDYAYSKANNLGGSQGIQRYYFNPIRSIDKTGSIRSRVLVCNYTDPSETLKQSHYTIYGSAKYLIGRSVIETCPQLAAPMKYIGYWHP